MRKTLLGLIYLVSIPLIINAQQSVLLFTNFPSDIKILENNSVVDKTPIWEKNKGGYLIDINNDVKTIITSSSDITFKLSDENKTTKNIEISNGDKISIFKCLNSEEYCCEKLSDRQQSATKKIYAVSLMKKSAMQKKTVVFENTSNDFLDKHNIEIRWKTDSIVKNISIYDVNTMEEIFSKDVDAPLKSIDYSEIKDGLLSDFAEGHNYVLKIQTRNLQDPITEAKESSYGFSITPLAFQNKQYYFSTNESLNINWKTKGAIKKVSLINKSGNEEIWSSKDYNKSNFTLEDMGDMEKILSGKEYQFVIDLDQGTSYTYSFVILLSQEESLDLFKVIE